MQDVTVNLIMIFGILIYNISTPQKHTTRYLNVHDFVCVFRKPGIKHYYVSVCFYCIRSTWATHRGNLYREF